MKCVNYNLRLKVWNWLSINNVCHGLGIHNRSKALLKSDLNSFATFNSRHFFPVNCIDLCKNLMKLQKYKNSNAISKMFDQKLGLHIVELRSDHFSPLSQGGWHFVGARPTFYTSMVFWYQNCSDLLWEKNVLLFKKTFEIWS